MNRIAVVVLADIESHPDQGRGTNALELAKEASEAGDEVAIVFDGAGTRWVPLLANPDTPQHRTFKAVEDSVVGACAFCASAFHVKDEIKETGVKLLSEFEGHPSIRSLVDRGFQVVTF